MDSDRPDPHRLPSVERLAAEFRRLEQAGSTRSPAPSISGRWRALALSGGGVAALLAAVLLLLDLGGAAHALSIVNRAPAAAERSMSVAFRSLTTITSGGRPVRRFSQAGQLDFATHEYQTSLAVIGAGVVVEHRSVSHVLYLGTRVARARGDTASHWVAARLTRAQETSAASAGEREGFTEPLALLRVLATTKSPVRLVGHEEVEGVNTKHYRLFSNLAAVLRVSSAPASIPSRYRNVTATLDVWLDPHGRPRRVIQRFAGGPSTGPALSTDTSFFSYGTPVVIRAPLGVVASPSLRGLPPTPIAREPDRIFERLLSSGG
jgi:hypothetical protein